MNDKLSGIDSTGCKDQELEETKQLVAIFQESCTVLNPIFSVSSYFMRLNVDYYKTAALALDSVVRKHVFLCF